MAYLASRLSGLAVADRPFVRERVAAKRPARDEMADSLLVSLALNSDRRAFLVLMRRYEGVLRGMVRRRVRSPEDATDR